MMDISIGGATHIYGDSLSVIINTSFQNQKNNAVCYHTVLESIAMGESLITHIDGSENPVNKYLR